MFEQIILVGLLGNVEGTVRRMCMLLSATKELRSDCTSRKILKIVAAHYMVILYPLSSLNLNCFAYCV